jgi:2-dehydro-3-deoxyglucarate aldolase
MIKLAWQQIPSPVVTELLCNTGLDGVVIDTEHAFFNNETLFSCIQTVDLSAKLCYVRVAEPNKTLVRGCLDAGADGIIFSTVETTDQCREIHDMCKYPQHGGRRGVGLIRQNRWGIGTLINNPPKIIAQIETVEGVLNIDAIAAYEFDFYMVGPYDLSTSLGIPGDFENENYVAAIERIKNRIPIHEMAVHIPTDVKNQLKKYEGYGMMAVGMDTTGLLQFYKEII